MRQKTSTFTRHLLSAATLGLLSLCATAQVASEYDPLRPIQQRIAKQNVILLLGNSASMREAPSFTWWDGSSNRHEFGHDLGTESVGGNPSASASAVTHDSGSGTACTGSKGRKFYYTVSITQVLPCKMALIKSALGNSVTTKKIWTPPTSWTYPSGSAWSGNPTITLTIPASSSTATWTIAWTKTYANCSNGPSAGPFTGAEILSAGIPSYDSTVIPGACDIAPGRLLDTYADSCNFALYSFSGTSGAAFQVAADLTDNKEPKLGLLNGKMGTTASGLSIDTATGRPTKCAVADATTVLNGYYTSPDPKRDCPSRGYAILLITDGIADECNGVAGSWSTCATTYSADYLPGATKAAWETTVGHNYRTWVLGLRNPLDTSTTNAAYKCELNWAAFMGRTDASRPADFGFTSTTTGATDYLKGIRATTDFTTTDYAFFAGAPDQVYSKLNTLLGGIQMNFFNNLQGETVTSPPIAYNYGGLRMLIPTTEMVNGPSGKRWLGHLHLYNLETSPPSWLWDAGAELLRNPGADHTSNSDTGRAIYTWNPSPSDFNDALKEVTVGNATAINGYCGGCGVTDQVINFIRGAPKGTTGAITTSTATRDWLLGPLLNSTPALVGGPEIWTTITNHKDFESRYSNRRPLVYVGSSDGMVHAFDAADGREVFALLPPDQLQKYVDSSTTDTHYNTWSTVSPTGQKDLTDQHIYGVANSIRVGDVYDALVHVDLGSGASATTINTNYRTVLYLTEGSGGKTLAAIDVSHPFRDRSAESVVLAGSSPTKTEHPAADNEFLWNDTNSTSPVAIVKLLWTKTSPTMGKTWSLPALGSLTETTSALSVGSGVTDVTDTNHPTYVFDALNGTPLGSVVNTGVQSGGPIISQAFADSIIWSTEKLGYKSDNLVNQALQGDLGGRLWPLDKLSSWSSGTLVVNEAAHPIYHSPAVSTYGQGSPSKILYAFGSGSYYEKSTAITGPSSPFRATLFLKVKNISDGVVTSYSKPLTDIAIVSGGGVTLSDRAQVTASPMLFVPTSAGVLAYALWTVFDPDPISCGGTSYVVKLTFDPKDLTGTSTGGEAVSVGSGFASGLSVAGNKVVVAVSSTSGLAAPVVAPGLTVNVVGGPAGATDLPNYYVELQ